jgi:hypothetical protein
MAVSTASRVSKSESAIEILRAFPQCLNVEQFLSEAIPAASGYENSDGTGEMLSTLCESLTGKRFPLSYYQQAQYTQDTTLPLRFSRSWAGISPARDVR